MKKRRATRKRTTMESCLRTQLMASLRRYKSLAFAVALTFAIAPPSSFAAQDSGPGSSSSNTAPLDSSSSAANRNLADLDLDQLMSVQVKVTSVSKKEEGSFQAPAAIFVLTAEDIRRGGFASLPEALRMVPGLYVARTDANNWTIAARGLVSPNNDKLLVLLDGRELYDPFFGGTYWDVQDLPLEDVERVEVILGPGGTLWGDNAVNGVINIITKSSKDTQGASVALSSGMDEEQTASVRYGGQMGGALSYRVFGKSSYWDAAVNPLTGASLEDEWSVSQGGIRMDWKPSKNNSLMIEGQLYEGRDHNTEHLTTSPATPIVPVLGSNVLQGQDFLARWDHTLSDRASLSLLGYCEWTKRGDLVVPTQRNTCDLEFQHNISFGDRHAVNWGLTFFTTGDKLGETFMTSYTRPSARHDTVSGFGQYELKVIPDRVRLIVGSKFEHNDYTGFEIQPQIRAVGTPTKSQTIWAAVSRAVKLPNRVVTDINLKLAELSNAPPTYLALLGNPDLPSQALRAYEMGYRLQITENFSLDASIYYNHYDNLIGVTFPPPIVNPNPFYIEIPEEIGGNRSGQTHGGEIYVKFRPLRPWFLSVGATELRGTSADVEDTPRHFFNIQSRVDLPHTFELDSALYYDNAIPGITTQPTPTHNRIDLGLGAHPIRGLTVSVWGNDISNPRALESVAGGAGGLNEVGALRRSVVFKVMWQSDPEKRGTNR
jgi:iron complex outermembrane recepter protein